MALAVVTKSFRLTAKEYEEFKVLRGWRYRYDWSEVIKGALKDAVETKLREFNEPKPLFKLLEENSGEPKVHLIPGQVEDKAINQALEDAGYTMVEIPKPAAKKPAAKKPAAKKPAAKPTAKPAAKPKPRNKTKEKLTNGNS